MVAEVYAEDGFYMALPLDFSETYVTSHGGTSLQPTVSRKVVRERSLFRGVGQRHVLAVLRPPRYLSLLRRVEEAAGRPLAGAAGRGGGWGRH